jgi:hypothetical protein
MAPILDELNQLENGQGSIDGEEFIDALFRLQKHLNAHEKDLLCNFDKPPVKDPYAE